MRIGVDASCWANGRGYGRFTREVLRFLPSIAPADEFVCFADPWLADELDLPGSNVRTVRVAQRAAPVQAASADGNRSVRDMLHFTHAVSRERLDVFFSPSVYTYFPLPPGLPAVVTVHDAIAERFPKLTFSSKRARLFWWAKVKTAIWQARLILTVSDYSANEIARVLGVPRARLRVAWEAPAPAFRPSNSVAAVKAAAERAGLPPGAQWFVYVGGFNPHKRIDVLVRAHAALARELGHNAPYLVLVGALKSDVFHKDVASIHALIEAEGTERLVRWPGFIPDEELRDLYTGAIALVLPSESEGFGLPAVEAAACGTAVIATTESPLPALLVGGGLFVQPADQDAWTAALHQLATDRPLRDLMAARARERACQLTWPRSARAVLAALHEAGNGLHAGPVVNARAPLQRVGVAG